MASALAVTTSKSNLFERPLLEKGGIVTPFSAPREVLNAVVRRTTIKRATGTWLDVGGGSAARARVIGASIEPRNDLAVIGPAQQTGQHVLGALEPFKTDNCGRRRFRR